MAENNKNNFIPDDNDIKKYIKNKTIHTSKVTLVSKDAENDTTYLLLPWQGRKVIIYEDDVDSELFITSLTNFVNRRIQFVITENLGDGKLKASRAIAQEITKKKALKEIESGKTINAQVVNILPHGAYVEYQGVTGLLKNTDFANDMTPIKDVLGIGSNIKVKFKKYSSNGSIIFEASNKYVDRYALTIDDISEDSIVSGVVRAIQTFGVFVQVVVGYDALCSNRYIGELEEDDRVNVRITMVDKENKRIRGEIVGRS